MEDLNKKMFHRYDDNAYGNTHSRLQEAANWAKEDTKNQKSNNEIRQEVIEEYIININNNLHSLCEFMKLDLKEIQHISTDKETREAKRAETKKPIQQPFVEDEKRAIVASIIADELNGIFNRNSMEMAGITQEDFDELSKSPSVKSIIDSDKADKERINRMKMLAGIKNHDRPKNTEGQAPPKTDWKRVDLNNDEKNKILKSIRANPDSNIFSSDFKWEIKEFIIPFEYLESSSKYTGPFIVNIVSNKKELEKYSKIENISKGINSICFGKYLLLSIYDITASDEAKNIYMGLNYIGMTGRLEFAALGSTSGFIKKSQKALIKEYLDSMEIIYDKNHVDLN